MWQWKYIRLLVHRHFKSHLFIREQGDLHKASYMTVKWVFDTKLVEVSTSQTFWIAQKREILVACFKLQHKINIYNYLSFISLCNKELLDDWMSKYKDLQKEMQHPPVSHLFINVLGGFM